MFSPQQLAQGLMQNNGVAQQPNMMQQFLPINNAQGQLQYPTQALQGYAQGRPMYMAGQTNNPIVNDMAHQMQNSTGGTGRLLYNMFNTFKNNNGQNIFDQFASQVPYK